VFGRMLMAYDARSISAVRTHSWACVAGWLAVVAIVVSLHTQDLVTETDVAAQRAIKQLILHQYPQHSFLGEEDVKVGQVRRP
jgi:3'-phosphoadenosine 5'-phosphosulfate (PAPS) 3'-phosphatase